MHPEILIQWTLEILIQSNQFTPVISNWIHREIPIQIAPRHPHSIHSWKAISGDGTKT